MKTAFNLSTGESAVLRELVGSDIFVARLRELGFIPGVTIYIKNRVLFGDPILIDLSHITVALRREEAKCLRID
jgi:Fe2+ transport system protein FeoA